MPRSPDADTLDVSVFMPLYVSDWLTGGATFVMSNRQRGAFVQLLAHAWKQDASLPDDLAVLAKYADEPREWFDTSEGAHVLAQFPIDDDGRRRNPKQTAVYLDSVARREKSHNAAVAGAKARWKRQPEPATTAPATPTPIVSPPVDFTVTTKNYPAVEQFANDRTEYRATLDRALTRVLKGLGPDSLAGFAAVVGAALQGMDGPQLSFAEMHTALADWCDNNGRLEKNALRAYWRGAKSNGANASNGRTSFRRPPSNGAGDHFGL